MPSSRGITRSVTTMSAGCRRIASSASWPSATARTSKPSAVSKRVRVMRCDSVSSASTTRNGATAAPAAAAAARARAADGDSPSYSASSSTVEVSRVSTSSSLPHSRQDSITSGRMRSKSARDICRRSSSGPRLAKTAGASACCAAHSRPVTTASSTRSASRCARGAAAGSNSPRPTTAATSGAGICQSASISPVSSRWQARNVSRSTTRCWASVCPAMPIT
jgi:hypothetical protein